MFNRFVNNTNYVVGNNFWNTCNYLNSVSSFSYHPHSSAVAELLDARFGMTVIPNFDASDIRQTLEFLCMN